MSARSGHPRPYSTLTLRLRLIVTSWTTRWSRSTALTSPAGSHERDAEAAIILITGHPDASIQAEARRAGIYSVLLNVHLQEVLGPRNFSCDGRRNGTLAPTSRAHLRDST